MRIIRAGEHVQHIPGYGITVREAGVGMGATVCVSDSFTDTNGTLLADHTPEVDTVGDGWTSHLGDWKITSGYAYASSSPGSPFPLATINAGVSDVVYTVKARRSSTGPSAIITRVLFRFIDTANFWTVDFSDTARQFILRKVISGAATTSSSIAWPVDFDWHTFVITLLGQSIEVNIDSSTYTLSATDGAHQTATRFGFGSRMANSGQFDDVQIVG